MPSAAQQTSHQQQGGTATAMVLADTLRLADGTLVEHRLMAMASDLWAARPESRDPAWIASEWNGATIAYRIDS